MTAPKPATLVEMLEIRARDDGARCAYVFEEKPHTFEEVWEGAGQVAAHLLALGLGPGDRVVLVLPNGPEFFHAFYGAQRAGGVAVPIFPGSGPERTFGIAALCGARVVVAPSTIPAAQLAAAKERAKAAGVAVTTTVEAREARLPAGFPRVEPGDLAFLQYTSGSTGDPKGVMLPHGHLLKNVQQMIAGMEITPRERFVSWLPAYHDMGLILKTITPFLLGAELFLYPSSLSDVRTWLEAIRKHRATFTAAPDFAYRLCLRRVRGRGEYDLSSLRVALNAAEPVRATTLAAFHERFGLENVMVGAYGLAEATVGVSMWPPGTENRIDRRGFVSVGRPFPEVEVKIGSDGGGEAAPGETGEILVRSPANAPGYFGNPEATRALFRDGGFIDTGDLGFVDGDGYLYIVGRKKNVILSGGRTIAPREVEELVDRQPLVRFNAAVGIDHGGLEGEQVHVFAEIRTEHPGGGPVSEAELEGAAREIVAGVHAELGFRPARVILLRPRSIPLTHNGKVQHVRLRDAYLDGSLRAAGAILFPA